VNAEDKIRKGLETFMPAGEASACQVYKGWDYDGVRQSYGWWYRPFNRQAVYLGANVDGALDTIDAIRDSKGYGHYYSEDGLLEWDGETGELVCDHHKRKFGTPHPDL